jgi:hypothetical protein
VFFDARFLPVFTCFLIFAILYAFLRCFHFFDFVCVLPFPVYGYFQAQVDAKLIKDCAPPIDGWAPVIQLGGTPTEEQLLASYGNVVPEGVPQDHELTEESEQIRAAMEGCRLAEELLRRAVVHNAIEARRTGNHHRNHMIAVPTAVGQPLRG